MRTRRFILAAFAVLTAGSVCAEAALAAKNSPTAGKAGKSKHPKKRAKRERGQKTPTPERISEIQQALAKDGSFAGTPNGKWDAATVEAMRKFQAGHGLNPTGKLDALTLQKLGLGSDTAGVAAPLRPVNSASNTSRASRQR